MNNLLVNGSIPDENLATAVDIASYHEYTIVALGELAYTAKRGDVNSFAL